MPKILDDARIHLIRVAKKQALTNGYPGMTIRSVAQECGYSVGTVYNYFKSKEMLVAAFMLEDWKTEVEKMQETCKGATPREALERIYGGISHYGALYSSVFLDRSAQKSYALNDHSYHSMLLTQITAILEEVFSRSERKYSPLLVSFLAENLILWGRKGCPYEDLAQILNKLLE